MPWRAAPVPPGKGGRTCTPRGHIFQVRPHLNPQGGEPHLSPRVRAASVPPEMRAAPVPQGEGYVGPNLPT